MRFTMCTIIKRSLSFFLPLSRPPSIARYYAAGKILVIFQRVTMDEPKSEIQSFYKDKTIFITGGSGFMGKVLIEKLLYSCSDLNKIYVLMRTKRDRNFETRLEEMFKLPVRHRANNATILYFNVSDER